MASSWCQKSLDHCFKILQYIVIMLSLFGVLFYWKSSVKVEHSYKPVSKTNQLFSLNGIPASYNTNHSQSGMCNDVLKLMREARWIKRKNVTLADEIQQRNTEIEIRKKRGLPAALHRTDSRCGSKPFFLNTPNFDYPIPAICDVNSATPCCNHRTKWCGTGPANCNCERCTDYRREISAEIFNWAPFNGCIFTNFTSTEACRLMSDSVAGLVLIGDSLVRHLFNALLILFTNDMERGSLRLRQNVDRGVVSSDEVKHCQGVMQFVDGGKTSCHTKTLRSIPHESKRSFCQGKYKFDFAFKEYYSMNEAANILTTVRRNLNKERTIVALGVGLHINLDAEKVQKKIMEPVLNIKTSNGAAWPYILWLSVHAHGSLKDANYNFPSHNDRIAQFNSQMEKYLSAYGIPVFDTFNLTSSVRSIDGTHFGMGLNMVKAQLFLNFIKETFQTGK